MVDNEQQQPKVYFYVTGFGKFANILENPTSIMVRDLPELLRQQAENPEAPQQQFELKHSQVVKVSIQDCDEALDGLYNLVKGQHGAADHHVIINFGVHDGS